MPRILLFIRLLATSVFAFASLWGLWLLARWLMPPPWSTLRWVVTLFLMAVPITTLAFGGIAMLYGAFRILFAPKDDAKK